LSKSSAYVHTSTQYSCFSPVSHVQQSGGGNGFSSQWRFPDELSDGVCFVGRGWCVFECLRGVLEGW